MQNNFVLLSAQQHFFALMLCGQFEAAAAKARAVHAAHLEAAGEGHPAEARWRDMEREVWRIAASSDEAALAAFVRSWRSPPLK